MLMLVHAREPEPDPDPAGRRRGDGLLAVLGWVFPWPFAICWLVAGAWITDGWAGVGLAWSALFVAFWRMTRAWPEVGGLRDHSQ